MANMEFKCPCCGGALQFDNKSQNIVCPYCDSSFSADDLKAYTDELAEEGIEDTSWDESSVRAYSTEELKGMKVYTCNSCGGEIIVDATTSSTSCPYCNNNILVSKELSGDLKPNYIIPFKKDKEFAKTALKSFFKKKILLPSSFSKENVIEEIKPLYVPFWLFDADVSGKVRFRGERYRSWSDSEYTYRETSYYSITRAGDIAFSHVPVDGSLKMEDELMESIEPYNFNEVEEFNAAYLAGYAADRYDVSKEETFTRATSRIREGTVMAFKNDISGYSNIQVMDSNINLSNTSAKYALYPVWILNTKWNDEKFRFAINGQTGKIAGNLPISMLKAILVWLISFLVIGGLATLLSFLIDKENIATGIVVSLIIGIIFATIILLALWKVNKNVRFQRGAQSYIRSGSLNIKTRRSIFLYKKVSRTRRAQSSNNNRR